MVDSSVGARIDALLKKHAADPDAPTQWDVYQLPSGAWACFGEYLRSRPDGWIRVRLEGGRGRSGTEKMLLDHLLLATGEVKLAGGDA